jgi:hypothetical protein
MPDTRARQPLLRMVPRLDRHEYGQPQAQLLGIEKRDPALDHALRLEALDALPARRLGEARPGRRPRRWPGSRRAGAGRGSCGRSGPWRFEPVREGSGTFVQQRLCLQACPGRQKEKEGLRRGPGAVHSVSPRIRAGIGVSFARSFLEGHGRKDERATILAFEDLLGSHAAARPSVPEPTGSRESKSPSGEFMRDLRLLRSGAA